MSSHRRYYKKRNGRRLRRVPSRTKYFIPASFWYSPMIIPDMGHNIDLCNLPLPSDEEASEMVSMYHFGGSGGGAVDHWH